MPNACKFHPPRLLLQSRPSVLDPVTEEDPWIKRCEANQRHVLYIQAQPVAMLAALPFDIVSLNLRLFDLRRRRPREGFSCFAVTARIPDQC
jgi:hypothetical protein